MTNNTMLPVSYKFIASAVLTAAKAKLYKMTPQIPEGTDPSGMMGRFFQVSLALGTTEQASDLVMEEAVCTVTRTRKIVQTSLVGMSGSIKEYISNDDFFIEITAALVSVENGKEVDRYPADGVRDLRTLCDRSEALYVDSEFLRLFDITKLVIKKYKIEQMTHSNRQQITLEAFSDEDYIIKYNEY